MEYALHSNIAPSYTFDSKTRDEFFVTIAGTSMLWRL